MHERVVWFDVPVTDLDRAIVFYSAVLNCTIERHQGANGPLGVITHRDGEIAGCLFHDARFPPSDQGLLLYFNVDGRLEEATANVTALGGKVLKAIHDLSPYGYRAIVLDSEGNRIALHTYV